MIEITSKSREFTRVEEYLMTQSPAIVSMKDVPDNTSIEVSGFIEFTETKDDGSETNIISVLSTDMKCYSAQSATFKRSLLDIHDLFEDRTYAIIKTSGVTKAGRDYINCELDVEYIMSHD